MLDSAKTLKQLANELGCSESKIKKDLEKMLSLGVVKKAGGRYCLAAAVRRGFMERKEEKAKNVFKAHIIIEGHSKDKIELEKANKDLIKKLEHDRLLTVSDIVEEKPIFDDETGYYSTFFECDVETKSFEDLVYCVITYGPSSIELEEPSKFELTRAEGQGVLMDVASTLHTYIEFIAKLKMDQDILIKKG